MWWIYLIIFLSSLPLAHWMHHWPPGGKDQWNQANVRCPDQDRKSGGWLNWSSGHHHRLSRQHKPGRVPHQRQVSEDSPLPLIYCIRMCIEGLNQKGFSDQLLQEEQKCPK